jgi:hypothetical protein
MKPLGYNSREAFFISYERKKDMNNRRTFFIVLTFFSALVACVVPGLQPALVPTPAPAVDNSIVLSTMVAETVSAAIVLTEQVLLTPEAMPTITPTIPPTAEIIPAGSTLTIQEDGTTLFVDERAGYQITVPAGWLAVRIDQQEYRDALTVAPDVQKSLADIQNNDPNTFRLYALDTQDGHVVNEFFTNINIVWDEQGAVLLNNDEALKARAAQLAETTPGLEILSTKFITTSNNVLVGLIELKTPAKNSSDAEITAFQKQAIFNGKTGTVAVTVSTVEELKETIFPVFDAMLETIKVAVE